MDRAIPVFAFHRVGTRRDCRFTVGVDLFERYLTIIRDEGYASLTCSDLVDVAAGRAPLPKRACVLTFDDGYADVWVYAVPLLRRFGMRATVFVVLDRLTSSKGVRATLEDVWSGSLPASDLYQLPELRHVNRRCLDGSYDPSTDHISVEEARAMVSSGVCDIQSHGPDHMVHYSSERLTGFLRPESHWTAFAAAHGDWRFGTPIYETCSSLVMPRYRDSRAIRDHLAGVVGARGGRSFFDRPGWREELSREFRQATSDRPVGYCEPTGTWADRTVVTLLKCIHELAERVGNPVSALAWPFGSTSEAAQTIARRAGFSLALTTSGGGYVQNAPDMAVGRIALKDPDAERFRDALIRNTDAEFVRQQIGGSAVAEPLRIAI